MHRDVNLRMSNNLAERLNRLLREMESDSLPVWKQQTIFHVRRRCINELASTYEQERDTTKMNTGWNKWPYDEWRTKDD